MKVTKIQAQKNKDRVNVYLDGQFAFGTFKEIACKHNLKVGMDIDKDFIDNILKSEELQKAKNYSLNLLNYRWRAEKEIRDRLLRKNFNEDIIEKTVQYLKEYDLINDKRFAEIYAESRVRNKKFGTYRIKYELSNKGISREIIDKVLYKYEDSEYERALELGRKRIKSYKGDDKAAIYRKLGGYLQRRGYSYECVNKVLRKLI